MERIRSAVGDICLTEYFSMGFHKTFVLSKCMLHSNLNHQMIIEMRDSHFTAQSLRMLFQDISPENVFNFLKEISILGKI